MAGGAGEDHLSALPDDVLRLILLRLPSTAEAARISALSRHWRHLWTTLTELRLPDVTDLASVRAVLRRHPAPVLHKLHARHELTVAGGRVPDKIAAVLGLAAPRLEGELCFEIITPANQNPAAGAAGVGGTFQIPCFNKATEIIINLPDHLGIRLPPTGVFAKLTVMMLTRLDKQNQRDLGGAVSSEGCPSLQHLILGKSYVSSHLAIRSESLLRVRLFCLRGLERLTVVAPVLKELGVNNCLVTSVASADISAPAVEELHWIDGFDPLLVQFSAMPRLWSLAVCGAPSRIHDVGNSQSLPLLQRFVSAREVHILLMYPFFLANFDLMVEAEKTLPAVEILCLKFCTRGHAFGPCLFHFLRMCTSIRQLDMDFDDGSKPQVWETMNICLNFLQKVEMKNLSGTEYEISFVKQLLRWVPMLKTITLRFDHSVSEEVCMELLSLSTPGICMEIYLHRNGDEVKYSGVSLKRHGDD
uniref:F-box domain-containing protein n=1 Tax=Oryza brachyantha TaxID=4533 RepID=J3MJK0_ORYBR